MRKNGFTLIELLAVIVILAIIALIATPIILGIINDAREKANERSVELYASAVRNAVAAYQLTGVSAPKSFSDLTIQYDGDVKCTVQQLYSDGSFYLEGCTVNDGDKEYGYGTKKNKISDVCTIATDSIVQGLSMGAKYNCKVDPNKPEYTFYVLKTPASGADSVNLIMDSNIRTGGEAVKEATPTTEQKGLVAWHPENINSKGPIPAMDYLEIATSNWTNANKQTVSTFTSCDNKGVCTDKQMEKTYVVNARMPHISEVIETGCGLLGANAGACPGWMTNYLNDYKSLYPDRSVVSGLNGYWTLSSYTLSPAPSFYVTYGGTTGLDASIDVDQGVRPVINLSI